MLVATRNWLPVFQSVAAMMLSHPALHWLRRTPSNRSYVCTQYMNVRYFMIVLYQKIFLRNRFVENLRAPAAQRIGLDGTKDGRVFSILNLFMRKHGAPV